MIRYFDKYGFWIRFRFLSGRGLVCRWDKPLFGIRNGYTRCIIKIGNFRVRILGKW